MIMAGKRISSGMIEPYIKRYLESDELRLDAEILKGMTDRFSVVTQRQFMENKKAKRGSYPAGGATKCARSNALAYLGAETEPLKWQTIVKFWLGDLTELGVLGIIQMAWKDTPHEIGLDNERLEIMMGSDPETRAEHGGYPDALINFDHLYHKEQFGEDLRLINNVSGKPFPWCESKEMLIAELKSMGDYPFNGGGKSNMGFRNVGPEDTWGYLGQVTNYQRNLQIRRFLFIALWLDKAEILTHLGVYDKEIERKIDDTHDLVFGCLNANKLPPVPDNDMYGLKSVGGRFQLKLGCRFCARKAACYGDLGYVLKQEEGRPYQGKPTNPHYYAIQSKEAQMPLVETP